MVLSYNFAQLGEELLYKDSSWIIPVVVRSSLFKKVMSGWSHMLAVYLRVHLLGAQGLTTAGVTVMIDGQPLTIYARVLGILSDYDGIRMGWDWRGATCIRVCLHCANVFKQDSGVAERLLDCQESTCTDPALLIERTDSDFEHEVDTIIEAGNEYAEGRITKKVFDDIQMALGQHFNPLGFVSDRDLREIIRPLAVINQDWVHGLLSNGVLACEMTLFL